MSGRTLACDERRARGSRCALRARGAVRGGRWDRVGAGEGLHLGGGERGTKGGGSAELEVGALELLADQREVEVAVVDAVDVEARICTQECGARAGAGAGAGGGDDGPAALGERRVALQEARDPGGGPGERTFGGEGRGQRREPARAPARARARRVAGAITWSVGRPCARVGQTARAAVTSPRIGPRRRCRVFARARNRCAPDAGRRRVAGGGKSSRPARGEPAWRAAQAPLPSRRPARAGRPRGGLLRSRSLCAEQVDDEDQRRVRWDLRWRPACL